MTYRGLLSSVSCAALAAACGTNNPARGDGGGDARGDAAVDVAHFGTLTARGPRVSGTSMGQRMVHGVLGTVYDTTGDGTPDEIDVDGDGISDGEDVDGDGNITLWSQLNTGERADPNAEDETPAIDPSFSRRLDPMHPLRGPGVQMETGMVVPPASVMPPAEMAGVLTALSQGQQSSCSAWATAAAATLVRYRRESAADGTLDVNQLWASPSWLYARMLGPTMANCNEGTFISAGLNLLVTDAPASLMEQPYRSGDMPTVCESETMSPATMGHVFNIGSYNRLRGTGMVFRTAVRSALAAGLPVALGVSLPMGFQEFRRTTQGVDVTMPFRGGGMCPGTQHCGGHAMVLVGYDDERGAYRVLNSWGTDWGDSGYLWWDYAALEAQPGLEAYEVLALPDAPAPLAAPNAAALTMTQPAGSQPVATLVDGVARLYVRVQFSEPVTITELLARGDTVNTLAPMTFAVRYGDLAFVLLPNPPAQGSILNLTVNGRLRDGATFTKTLMVAMPTML